MTTIDRSGTSPLPYSNLPTRPKPAAPPDYSKEQTKVRLAFASPAGREALDVLRGLFALPPAYDPDNGRMVYVEGQRSVLAFIQECIDE